jgi:hypothetical protein
MTASDIYKSVRSFVRNHDHRFENVFVHNWEADSFSVTSSKYSYEIEVKASRSDFFVDFRKPKHDFFRGYKRGYGVLRGKEHWIKYHNLRDAGHPDLVGYEIRWTNISPLKLSHKNCPNKFFYACPEGLIKVEEIPDYAGLIYQTDKNFEGYKVIKNAPFLHKDEFNEKDMLFDKYYWKYVNMQREIRDRDWTIECLREDIKKLKAERVAEPKT